MISEVIFFNNLITGNFHTKCILPFLFFFTTFDKLCSIHQIVFMSLDINLIDSTIYNFFSHFPYSQGANTSEIIKVLFDYDVKNEDFDLLFWTIFPALNFSMTTPIDCLFQIILIPKVSEKCTRISRDAINYLSTIITLPDAFNTQSFHQDDRMIFQSFVNFVHNNTNQRPDFVQEVISTVFENNTELNNFFISLLENFAIIFLESNLSESLYYLNDFMVLLNVNKLRHYFCQSNNFQHIMTNLFSKGIPPNSPEFSLYFSKGSKNDYFLQLDNFLSQYHKRLGSILRSCLTSTTKDFTYKFISSMIHNSNTIFEGSSSSNLFQTVMTV